MGYYRRNYHYSSLVPNEPTYSATESGNTVVEYHLAGNTLTPPCRYDFMAEESSMLTIQITPITSSTPYLINNASSILEIKPEDGWVTVVDLSQVLAAGTYYRLSLSLTVLPYVSTATSNVLISNNRLVVNQDGFICFSGAPAGQVITESMLLNWDAGNPLSYPGTGTTWTDLSGQENHGTLM